MQAHTGTWLFTRLGRKNSVQNKHAKCHQLIHISNHFYALTSRENMRAGRLNSKLRGDKIPQSITVMIEKTIKSFGVYSYFGGWVAITGYDFNIEQNTAYIVISMQKLDSASPSHHDHGSSSHLGMVHYLSSGERHEHGLGSRWLSDRSHDGNQGSPLSL